MVGSHSDYGYNEAVYDASQKLAKDDPNVKVITADNIPETDQVTQTMQSMVDKGAKVIFATSYGYFSYAEKFAAAHPDVIILHQGGFESGTFSPNFGTYWGQAFEPVSLGGMAAGGVTKTNKLGFVYAFPISQTIANIDAFELGAQSVNPAAQTYLVNTSNWCDPLKQKEAAAALISDGADVLTQHQDCQSTVIQAAKAAGKYVVGYHYDAESLDPSGWLTGSAWDWTSIYESITKVALSGSFKGSIVQRQLGRLVPGQRQPVDPGVVRQVGSGRSAGQDHGRGNGAQEAGRVGLHRSDHLPGRVDAGRRRPDDDLRPDQRDQLPGQGCRGHPAQVVTLTSVPAPVTGREPRGHRRAGCRFHALPLAVGRAVLSSKRCALLVIETAAPAAARRRRRPGR